MKITAISREKKHLSRLTLENGESIVLDSDVCIARCLHEGDLLTEDAIKELTDESDYVRAKSRALWLLDRYTYTERRLFEKLKQAGFGEKAASKAVARLKELGVINDNNLARQYAEDLSRRGISKRAAFSKLLQKGFDKNTVTSALETTEFDEQNQLNTIIERKYAAKLAAGETEKVYAALVRKGFSYRDVREALKKYSEQLEFTGDE